MIDTLEYMDSVDVMPVMIKCRKLLVFALN